MRSESAGFLTSTSVKLLKEG
ncbi:hypothetical protein AVEN_51917-1, partial [Araneus ventricosus]